jgi:hypothetical protein
VVKDEEGVVVSEPASEGEVGEEEGKMAEVVLGDFFKWELGESGKGYDLFYDYT